MDKEFVGKEISYAVLYDYIHHPVLGQFGPVLQNWTDSARKGVTMTQLETQVLVEVPEPKNPKLVKRLLIDNSGFKYRCLAD